jgi:ubiquinone/menaquinone biosynthesis C-methylase UbiE
MNSEIHKIYDRLFSMHDISGSILEVGCGPSPGTLLNMECFKSSSYRIGVNLGDYSHLYKHFDVLKCNANDMKKVFDRDMFDVVICHAVLEHDKYFWKTLREIRRVIKPGGTFFLGVPGLVAGNKSEIADGTVTYQVHWDPSDYYRFTTHAFEEILMWGYDHVEYEVVMNPPRIIGYGIRK